MRREGFDIEKIRRGILRACEKRPVSLEKINDVVHDIEMSYYRESGDASDAPPKILLDKIAAGELGVKTGKGFYTY